jgi:AcrR family transcriptional regulator
MEPNEEKITQRQERILDAAQNLFLEVGLRAATMQEIAQRAQVAKPTLYSHFPDKEAVFRASVLRVVERLKDRAQAGLDRGGDAADRISNMLVAKFSAVHAVIARSPHAEELMSEKTVHAGAEFAGLDAWLTGKIARVLAEAEIGGSARLAEILVACADGIHHRARDVGEIAEWVPRVVRAIVAQESRK